MRPRSSRARGPAADPHPGRGPGGDEPSRPRARRVFVAIPLPEMARREVTDLVESVQAAADKDVRDVRWVRLDGLHLTLRFIGLVEESRIEALVAAVASAAERVASFEVTINGAGAFPSASRPRTLWLGVTEGSKELAEAAQAVEDALADVGLERSARPYRAHLTLARSDGVRTGPDVARRMIEAAGSRSTTFAATELVLFETIQGGGPARYEPLHVEKLGAPTHSSLPEPRRRQPSPVLPSEPSAGVRISVGARRKEQRPGT